MPNSKLSLTPATLALAMVAPMLGAGCEDKGSVAPPAYDSGVPVKPSPMPGQASLGGHVMDSAGAPVVGATVKIAETDAKAVTDAAGAYTLTVPSDSTVTLKAIADGFAASYRGSIVLADQVSVADFDVHMMTPAEVTNANALGGVAHPETRGLIALRLHSVADGCTTAGAHVSIYPPAAATVVYAQPAAAGAMDAPNPSIDAVQDGAAIGAWLVDVMPPANMLTITVEQSGCALAASSPSVGGLVFTGELRADAKALTVGDLFLGQTP